MSTHDYTTQELEIEEWRVIPGFPDYAVSENGIVKRITPGRGRGSRCRVGRILKQYTNTDGYQNVGLMPRGGKKGKTLDVHRLVAMAFLGEPPTSLHQTAHNDGNPNNNSIDNLRWATSKENSGDREKHGRTLHGSRSPLACITEADVIRLFMLVLHGDGTSAAAHEIGIARSTAQNILQGRSWSHVDPEMRKRAHMKMMQTYVEYAKSRAIKRNKELGHW